MDGASTPARTCVGCRARDAAPALLRVVVDASGGRLVVVTGHRGRFPGRGASLHPSLECLALAERRHAFGRAFRGSGPLDTSDVRRWLERRTSASAGTSTDQTTP